MVAVSDSPLKSGAEDSPSVLTGELPHGQSRAQKVLPNAAEEKSESTEPDAWADYLVLSGGVPPWKASQKTKQSVIEWGTPSKMGSPALMSTAREVVKVGDAHGELPKSKLQGSGELDLFSPPTTSSATEFTSSALTANSPSFSSSTPITTKPQSFNERFALTVETNPQIFKMTPSANESVNEPLSAYPVGTTSRLGIPQRWSEEETGVSTVEIPKD